MNSVISVDIQQMHM